MSANSEMDRSRGADSVNSHESNGLGSNRDVIVCDAVPPEKMTLSKVKFGSTDDLMALAAQSFAGTRTAKIINQFKEWDSTHSTEKAISRNGSADNLLIQPPGTLQKYYDDYAVDKAKVGRRSVIEDVTSSDIELAGGNGTGSDDGDKTKELRGFSKFLEHMFHIEERGSTVRNEIFCGVIHFFACMYVVPVIPHQMAKAHYDLINTATVCSAMSALACICSAFLTNLPFVVSPPAAVSVFLAVYLRTQNLPPHIGNIAVVYSGVGMTILGLVRPLTVVFYKMIPSCLQVALGISIGFLVALAGCVELTLVVQGKFTILDMGPITETSGHNSALAIGFSAILVIGICIMKKIRGSFVWGMTWGTIIFWASSNTFPLANTIVAAPVTDKDFSMATVPPEAFGLLFGLFFLCSLALVGLSRAFSDISGLTKADDTIPRGRFLFLVCGFATIISGLNAGPPIILSPETGVGLKEGAKTGLATLVCGLCFFICTFFSPLFAQIPSAGTMPMLFMVGVLMMANAKKIKWDVMTEALPSFVTIFIVPFTFNLLRGAVFGYVTWGVLAFFSGEMYGHCKDAFYEFKALFSGDDIPSSTTDAGSDAPIPKTKSSERWYSLQSLGFGDIRLPKSKFDLSTVVHNDSAMDLSTMDASKLNTKVPPASTHV